MALSPAQKVFYNDLLMRKILYFVDSYKTKRQLELASPRLCYLWANHFYALSLNNPFNSCTQLTCALNIEISGLVTITSDDNFNKVLFSIYTNFSEIDNVLELLPKRFANIVIVDTVFLSPKFWQLLTTKYTSMKKLIIKEEYFRGLEVDSNGYLPSSFQIFHTVTDLTIGVPFFNENLKILHYFPSLNSLTFQTLSYRWEREITAWCLQQLLDYKKKLKKLLLRHENNGLDLSIYEMAEFPKFCESFDTWVVKHDLEPSEEALASVFKRTMTNLSSLELNLCNRGNDNHRINPLLREFPFNQIEKIILKVSCAMRDNESLISNLRVSLTGSNSKTKEFHFIDCEHYPLHHSPSTEFIPLSTETLIMEDITFQERDVWMLQQKKLNVHQMKLIACKGSVVDIINQLENLQSLFIDNITWCSIKANNLSNLLRHPSLKTLYVYMISHSKWKPAPELFYIYQELRCIYPETFIGGTVICVQI